MHFPDNAYEHYKYSHENLKAVYINLFHDMKNLSYF